MNETNQAVPPQAPPTIPPAMNLSYASSTWTQGQVSQVVTPTLTGAIGSTTFSATGQLPSGVTFNATTGAFTGPATWNLNATTISAGGEHSCAVLHDTTARCWGWNGSGQLGDGTTTPSSVPVAIVDTGAGTTLSGVTQISAGASHACAVLVDGTARCWGFNGFGSLGDNTTANSSVPVAVTTSAGTALSGVIQISAGGFYTCAVLNDGTARCWGSNLSGQLGNDSAASSSVPVIVTTSAGTALSGVIHISAGVTKTCALLADTTARCWGRIPRAVSVTAPQPLALYR